MLLFDVVGGESGVLYEGGVGGGIWVGMILVLDILIECLEKKFIELEGERNK